MKPTLLFTALFGLAAVANAADGRRAYLVQLSDKPAATYEGGIAGLAATRTTPGARLNARAATVANYTAYLKQQQNTVLAQNSGATLLHSYQLVYNGFSALLTDAEAKALRRQPGVAAVMLETPRKLDTHYTPTYLGLDAPGGLWSQLGGSGKAGENVIVGIIDTGIWPEHPAFSDRVDANGKPTTDASGTLAYGAPPAKWKGSCQAGDGFAATNCNNKLIGARSFNAAMLAGGAQLYWNEFDSPRDAIAIVGSALGHGTHTASTAAGNHGVTAVLDGMPVAASSGMAPRARVAAYKVCWTYTTPEADDGLHSSCMPGDSVAAIEQAVADGVDVLNYSIGGYASIDDPVDQAFLGASNAGVFVAASAGNSAGFYPVMHSVPWLTTVAATNHDKGTGAVLQVTDGPRFVGGSLNHTALPPKPFLYVRDAGKIAFDALSDEDKAARLQCTGAADLAAAGATPAALPDPALVNGKILICEAGGTAPKAKSIAAQAAGAAGMVLLQFDQAPHYVDYAVPTVDLLPVDSSALMTHLLAHPAATLAMSAFGLQDGVGAAPVVTYFSSRGPNPVAPGLMKPDLAAPGLEILAGTTPDGDKAFRDHIAANGATPADTRFRFHTGTSMASPHVAGLAALLKQQHPNWSPAAIRSALMTTALQTQDDGNYGDMKGALPWGQGSGLVQPNSAADPGLVYDTTASDYARFQCALGASAVSPAECQALGGGLADLDLNQPALTAPGVTGTETLKRAVTNVGTGTATYRATAQLPGYDVTVSPAELTLKPGETRSFEVKLVRTSAKNLEWTYGALEWTDGAHRVRSPLQARTMLIDTPDYVSSWMPNGKRLLPITGGSTAKLKVAVSGLSTPQRDILTVYGTADNDYGIAECLAGGSERVALKKVTIPPGTLGARFGVFQSDSSGVHDGFIDLLNLVIVDPHQQVVGLALWNFGGSASTTLPEPGEYTLCVSSEGPVNGVSATFALSSWIVGPGHDAGNVTVVAPAMLAKNATGTIAFNWAGLDNTQRYFGVASYLLNGKPEAYTEIFIDAEQPEGMPARPAPILKSPPVVPVQRTWGTTR
jgi:subtilisin family serine protease